MNWITRLFSRKRIYDDLSDEMQQHLAEKIDELVAGGVSREDATYAARREFGNAALIEEKGRETWQWPTIEALFGDIRYALRQLRGSPGFTTVAVITLALGIGANAAIFSLVNSVMLSSLPVSHPEQLYQLGDETQVKCCVNGGLQEVYGIFSTPLYRELRDHTTDFDELAAFQAYPIKFAVRQPGSTEAAVPVTSKFVSGNYFSMFGIKPAAGRMLTPSDDKAGAAPTLVMSYRAWQQQYELDPTLVGSSLNVDGVPFTVAGIAPPGFFGDELRPNPPDFWIPLSNEPMLRKESTLLENSGLQWLHVIGRLKAGVSPSAAGARLTVVLQQWLASPAAQTTFDFKDQKRVQQARIVLSRGGAGMTQLKNTYSNGLKTLMVVSGLVLLIACANIANLLLARGAANRLKISVRLALGAPRSRILRQLLTESLLLSICGGLAGLLVALWGTRTILALAFRGADNVPIHATPSAAVLGFAFGLSVLTGLIFGVAPAWTASRSNPTEALHGASRSTRDDSSLRKSLVILQAALSLVLLAGAGLFTRSLNNIEHQQFGFATDGRFLVWVNLPSGYSMEQLGGLYRQVQQRITQIPGVRNASYALYSPMVGDQWPVTVVISGKPAEITPNGSDNAIRDRVGPHYFETLGTRLLRGREIGEQDTPTSRHVAVVNQTFVRHFFKDGENPIGTHFGSEGYSSSFEIVGVVEDAQYRDYTEPIRPMYFLPFLQVTPYPNPAALTNEVRSNYFHQIVLQVSGTPENLQQLVRRTLAGIDPNITVTRIKSFNEQIGQNFNQERLIARLTGLFGLLALALASVGLYGVTAYSVAQRTREIGVRIALGSTRTRIASLVLRLALVQIAIGLAIGIPVALVGARMVSSQLFGVQGYDPTIFVGSAMVLIVCAVIAALAPAHRAASVDPMRALRTE